MPELKMKTSRYSWMTARKDAVAKVEKEIEGSGRLLIRPSGTEPLVRVLLEGQDVAHITQLAEGLADILTKRFG